MLIIKTLLCLNSSLENLNQKRGISLSESDFLVLLIIQKNRLVSIAGIYKYINKYNKRTYANIVKKVIYLNKIGLIKKENKGYSITISGMEGIAKVNNYLKNIRL